MVGAPACPGLAGVRPSSGLSRRFRSEPVACWPRALLLRLPCYCLGCFCCCRHCRLWWRFPCCCGCCSPEGQYNDLGTALLGDAVWVIKSLLSLGSDAEPINKHGNVICSLSIPCYYSARTLAIFCVTYLLLMVAASSINVPGGLL